MSSHRTAAGRRPAAILWIALLASLPGLLAAGALHASGETVPLNTFDLPPGASVTITFEVAVDNPLNSCASSVSNQGSISGDNFPTFLTDDPDVGGMADPTVTGLDVADLAITKDDGSLTEVPGTSVSYTITVTNAGPSDAIGATVVDMFPATITGVAWTCVPSAGSSCTAAGAGNINDSVTVLAGGTLTYTATGTVAASATGSLANTASVLPPVTTTDCNGANNSATDTDTLTPQADLAITKDDGSATAVPGDPVSYTITVSNAGPSDAVGAMVTDSFPATITGVTWTCVASAGSSCTAAGAGDINDSVTVLAGGTVTYTATGTIDPAATGMLSNTATVVPPGGTSDLNGANNSATDTDTLTPSADLAITKMDDADPPAPGANLTYTITVDNLGPSDATGVVVTDNLPAEVTLVATTGCAEDPAGAPTCTLGAIAAGGSASFDIEVSIDPMPPSSISNTATVAGNEPDPVAGNDSDTEDTTLDNVPPTVDAVDSVPSSGGSLDECEDAKVGITQLTLTFSEAMAEAGAGDVADPANYLLVGAGADNDITTAGCGAVLGDDVTIPVDGVAYDDVNFIATLSVNGGAPLPDDAYFLFACDSLTDAAGNALDGDGDMAAGTDFRRQFRADLADLLVNGAFDCDISAWGASGPVAFSNDDVDGASISGSIQVADSMMGTSSTISQCVALSGGDQGTLSLAVRLTAPAGSFIPLLVECGFFSDGVCATPTGEPNSTIFLVQDTGGSWIALGDELTAPVGTASAMCLFGFDPTATTVDGFLDSIVLDADSMLFSDDFESGGTVRWGHEVQ